MENTWEGAYLTEQLVNFGREFHERLHAALPSDPNAPEAIQLMTAWRELESQFIAFLDLVPFSDILQLEAMVKQTQEFEKELKALPGLRKPYKKPPKAEDEVAKTAQKAEEGEAPVEPVFT